MSRFRKRNTLSRKTVRRLIAGAAVFLLPFLVAEFFARGLMPEIAGSDRISRNPYRYRGWPEYIRAIKQKKDTTGHCVLITNCQGYGGEYNRNMIYAAELGKRLRTVHSGGLTNWVVHNWSVDGATSIDYMFLAASLVEHPPDVVIALVGHADFRSEHFGESLTYSRTDLARLLAVPAVRRALPDTFIARHARVEDRIRFPLLHELTLLRFREYFWCRIDNLFPGLFHNFYAPDIPFRPWRLSGRNLVDPIRHPAVPKVEPPITYDGNSSIMLTELADLLAEIPAEVRVLAIAPYEFADAPAVQTITREAEQRSAERGLLFWDLRKALPFEDFITSAHFARRNHVRMAELLTERIHKLMPEP